MNHSFVLLGALITLFLGSIASAGQKASMAPVVVELYTSEGCSSCPPADELVAEFAKKSPVDGVPLVILAYHVDYWDRLGWRDPFSSSQWTAEQNAAVAALHGDSLYTPQMVVDGRVDLVGSDRAAATKAIASAARQSKVGVALDVRPNRTDGRMADVLITVDRGAKGLAGQPAEVIVALTEDALATDVRRGENAGKKLDHTAVVRWLKIVGNDSANDGSPLRTTIAADAGWNLQHLNVVAFVRSPEDRHVYGAMSRPWPSP